MDRLGAEMGSQQDGCYGRGMRHRWPNPPSYCKHKPTTEPANVCNAFQHPC
jgi:hypothetical protein